MFVNSPESYDSIEKDLGILNIGDYCKICWDHKERFWVKVTSIDGDSIVGTVANDLVVVSEFDFGEEVKFLKCNIYDIKHDVLAEFAELADDKDDSRKWTN